jgi:hypothetical protein
MDDSKNGEMAALRNQTLKTARASGLKNDFRGFRTSPEPHADDAFFNDA